MSDYADQMLVSYAQAIGRLQVVCAEEPNLVRLRERAATVFADLDRTQAAARAASAGSTSAL